MKLAAHYNKVNIVVTLSVLLIGAVIYFFAIDKIINNRLDEELGEEVSEVITYVHQNQLLPKQFDIDENQVEFIKTNALNSSPRYFDTTYVNPRKSGDKSGRAFEGGIKFKGDNYRIRIIKSSESTVYLKQIITAITLVLILALLTILSLTNRYILNDLWKPFFGLLAHMKAFNISESSSFILTNNKVDEFADLDNAIAEMSSRVKTDFQNLKQFTENASHEMLTPLAVITSKLDTLIQDETLKKEHFDQIQDIYGAAGKLSRLNQSLLLLVKIENNLIADNDNLDLNQLINDKIRQFQELSASKEIRIYAELGSKEVMVSKHLMDILLNNLLSNAIRHNQSKGSINIYLTNDKLTIQNLGLTVPLNSNSIFDRFQKGSTSEGAGLGLTIVKNICNVYDWDMKYSFVNNLHTFSIVF
ncbi:HAMP domain-containing histidine kinase [Mucilaginibacter sp. RB4R14]|uniref:sensor histidine kinase n=1 Tax=Mucilaginibacter aurantiaciroseus TaxID=2949308 RepID=UPI002090CC71|nr:HAMP domain-containing sensor histidine kinase [Mucilaginibacter aurantiaciroseus]MCO5934738.1 HAMP domain-containing histidine kinase [Mucilaginibacter aurantiaciroseus]